MNWSILPRLHRLSVDSIGSQEADTHKFGGKCFRCLVCRKRERSESLILDESSAMAWCFCGFCNHRTCKPFWDWAIVDLIRYNAKLFLGKPDLIFIGADIHSRLPRTQIELLKSYYMSVLTLGIRVTAIYLLSLRYCVTCVLFVSCTNVPLSFRWNRPSAPRILLLNVNSPMAFPSPVTFLMRASLPFKRS
jgi:hypothetical protein